MTRTTAIFVGDGTLLQRCADLFVQQGGQIAGVVTSDPRIAAWAGAEGIAHLGSPADWTGGTEADYLFSVANVTALPPAALRSARRMAINFHDGRLPERSGLNVPAWAIIENAPTHAVTWHLMAERIDAGDILQERSFPIRPDDTAFTLNARCYEVGLELFGALLGDIFGGHVAARPQTGTGASYARRKRPESLGVLDLSRPAEGLDRLVRGLDFGGYPNPLALAKLWTGRQLVAVGTLEVLSAPAAPAGRVISVDQASITVATASQPVRLSELTDMKGAAFDPVAAGVIPGVTLPALPAGPVPDDIGRAEPAWRAALDGAAPAIPPYPRDHGAEAGRADIARGTAGEAETAAAWLAWTAALGGLARATIACADAAPAAPWLSRLRPVSLTFKAETTCAEAVTALAAARTEAEARQAMPADLPLRLGNAAARDAALAALSVAVTTTGDLPEGVQLALDPAAGCLIQRKGLFAAETLTALTRDFSGFLAAFVAHPDAAVADLDLGAAQGVDAGPSVAADPRSLYAAFADRVAQAPDAIALEAGTERLSYAELDRRASALSGALAKRDVGPGTVVGLCLERSAELVVAMLAILRTGAAYLPLDPGYPASRIAFMLSDSGAPVVVADRASAARLALDPATVVDPAETGDISSPRGGPDDLAYLIYTSGSTGQPKGVMVRQSNVTNFLAGMDATVPLTPASRLLAVTSVSFDISVLEILWTLTRGATLVLQTAEPEAAPDFSLFYFASEAAGSGHQAYRLLLDGARFADENGFAAIWTPERHFHAFGGLYPNPAISAAALSGITRNVKLRAGSSVLPLHHPVRVAEDWALVDNLSNGRAGVAIASGWQPNDFVLRPDAFANRKQLAFDAVETLRRLWRGEAVEFPGHDGKPVPTKIHPRPMQDEIPLWLTAAGNPETFETAGRLGCGVLTHLLGQTFAEVAEKIRSYRAARARAGHPGPGHVVLMLHSFLGDSEDEVVAAARGPMRSYLKSAVDLVRGAAWSFPTIVERADSAGISPAEEFDRKDLTPEELDALLDHAFERYYRSAGLFGTPDTAREIVRDAMAAGVDEVACLIDFGIETDLVLAHLPKIRELMDGLKQGGAGTRKASLAEDILSKGITHLQCTPSLASYLVADAAGRQALERLECLMIGGEAFPPDLARSLRDGFGGQLFNMYGPTETTIWSSVARLDQVHDRVPLGRPIANTRLTVRSPGGRILPDLVEGELWIAGDGVAAGYLQRPELTADRFVTTAEGRAYRTGDMVRRLPDGTYAFLGRMDGQVKLRGHRIELGEIEAVLAAHPEVTAAAVTASALSDGDVRLVAYVAAPSRDGLAEDLRDTLAARVPDYMVPSEVVVLDRMPLTPNGKIDRKALPVPGRSGRTADDFAAASGSLETDIARIWAELLGLERISVTGNFFDLGGHSLLVVKAQRRMQQDLGRDVAITDLFRFPTVRGIAAHMSGSGTETTSASDRGAARAGRRLARLGRQ